MYLVGRNKIYKNVSKPEYFTTLVRSTRATVRRNEDDWTVVRCQRWQASRHGNHTARGWLSRARAQIAKPAISHLLNDGSPNGFKERSQEAAERARSFG